MRWRCGYWIILGIICAEGVAAMAQNERAVERGLGFLVKMQNTDGSFGAAKNWDERSVASSVSLLGFVSAGQAPDLGKFGSAVRNATDYLLQAVQGKMPEAAREACVNALGEVAGIDDNPVDQQKLEAILRNGSGAVGIPPFGGSIAQAVHALRGLERGDDFNGPSSYSMLYRAAVFAARLRVDALSGRIDAMILARQQPDGSWGADVESTAYAVLALSANDEFMSVNPGEFFESASVSRGGSGQHAALAHPD